VARRGEGYIAVLDAGPEVNRHRPAVDVLFHSAAQQAGRQATGVLLTGMGKDGAAGLLALRETGAVTIAQDEASSLIFGMPREAIEIGAAAEVLALEAIAPRLQALSAAERPDQRHAAQPYAAQPHAPRPLRQAQRAASSASLQRLRGAGFKAASRREQA
jgi:two-component system chemotaxis response regulator CheB